MATSSHESITQDDDRQLAALGYKPELNRSWSGFSNFAISFSVISILSGCFTSFFVGWNSGGPVAIAWGWPLVSAFILVIGVCMSELVSAYPTSGGMYFWSARLGSIKASYYTGWLDFIGLLAITASVAYGCATFLDATIGTFSSSWASHYSLHRVFLIFLGVLAAVALISIFSSHLLALLNNISVWWHVAGVAVIIVVLVALPHHHQSVAAVFTHTVNNTGFFGGHTSGLGFLFYVLPLAAILPQYTITGYDASCHLSEETVGAADSAAKGIWKSILYSAIGGWVLMLSFLFAVQDPAKVTAAGGGVATVLTQALSPNWAGFVLLVSSVGQFFCAVACMTSITRMLYAFSRDGAVPGARYWTRLTGKQVPVYGMLAVAVLAVLLTLPALVTVDINGAPVPVAFNAIISIGVVGLYLSFAIPIFLRWRAGDAFKPGGWTLGAKYKWLCVLALAEIAVTTVIAVLPTSPGGMPGNSGFSWKYVNYTPLVVGGALILLWAAWHLSVKKTFTGPRQTIDSAADLDTVTG
jgi:amino acid transporter